MPSQPMAKKVLKMNRKAAAVTPVPDDGCEVVPARMAIEADIPTAPNSMSERRPNFSMVNTAIHDARKYSVPFAAARIREMKGVNPMFFS